MHWMIHLRKSWRKLCEDVPGLIRVIASPCRATVAFQHYLVRGHNMLGKGLDNDAKTFDVGRQQKALVSGIFILLPISGDHYEILGFVWRT